MALVAGCDLMLPSVLDPKPKIALSELPSPWVGKGVPHASTASVVKRLLDVVGAILGLAIIALIFVPIALAIRLDSPGPVLYCQQRHGLLGKPFRMYKFRSMVTNAEALKSQVKNEAKGLIFKNAEDPRVTKVGRFLRRTSLDELPQFWNVVTGEMSLVGTRPPTFDEVAKYNDRHWRRLLVKPGLTGEWQVNGRSTVNDFEKIVDLDLHYQAVWHPLYDLVLIFRTIYVIFARVGAV